MAFRGHRRRERRRSRNLGGWGVAGGFGGAEARRVLYIQGAGHQQASRAARAIAAANPSGGCVTGD